jgi:hypothetical protein
MKYEQSKKECQKKIDELNNVCDRCGKKIVPLKTVNNSGEPTYWAGCLHGDKECGHFTHGVTKETFDLATKLVLENSYDFGLQHNDEEIGFVYAWENAVYRNCDKLKHIEYIKNAIPRYCKEELIRNHKKYFKND